eukprot:6844606-Prymnesium_polylepis.1
MSTESGIISRTCSGSEKGHHLQWIGEGASAAMERTGAGGEGDRLPSSMQLVVPSAQRAASPGGQRGWRITSHNV